MNDSLKQHYHAQMRNGWKPNQDYVFVSYASRDWEKVYPTVLALREQGINVYIDVEFMENQSASWLKNFQERLFRDSFCKGMITFLSISYMRSYACLMEQLANRTDKMQRRHGKPLPVFYVALQPEMESLQQILSYIYSDQVRTESVKDTIEMSPPESAVFQRFVLDSHYKKYRDADAVRDMLDEICDRHDIVTTMYELIFAECRDMPNIQAFLSPEDCAEVLTSNFVNDKNNDIKLYPSRELSQETKIRRMSQEFPEESEPLASEPDREPVTEPEPVPARDSSPGSPMEEQLRRMEEELRRKEEELRRKEEELRQREAESRRREMLRLEERLNQESRQEIEELTAGAENGDPQAQTRLAEHYADGNGVPQDWKKAVRWYRRAAEQGDACGQYRLALCYYNGGGLVPEGGGAGAFRCSE